MQHKSKVMLRIGYMHNLISNIFWVLGEMRLWYVLQIVGSHLVVWKHFLKSKKSSRSLMPVAVGLENTVPIVYNNFDILHPV